MRKLRLPGTTASATGFTDEAIREIGDANRAMDTGECGKLGDTGAATPCKVETEEFAALVQLLTKGATEAAHFDAEKIQEGSNLVFNARTTIRRYLLEGNFAGARRVLGNALHSIQDFYTHTNWVELGRGGVDSRLGTRMDAFSSGSPRLSFANEPMCVDVGVEESWLDSLGPGIASAGRWIGTHLEGSTPLSGSGALPDRTRFLTQMTKAEQDRLVKAYADAEAKAKSEGKTFESPITAAIILRSIADRPLTSGYFYLAYPEVTYSLESLPSLDDFINLLDLPGREDLPAIAKSGKCRHGWSLPVFSRFGATFTYRQQGINKDDSGRARFEAAREPA
ncbi:MAG: hypothetical protein E8D45_08020, partial [Nitrospira sp.]